MENQPAKKKHKKICTQGHVYYKSADCAVCPACERERISAVPFYAALAAPARRALERQRILSPKMLAEYSEREILALHGIGPSSIPVLKAVLQKEGLNFKS